MGEENYIFSIQVSAELLAALEADKQKHDNRSRNWIINDILEKHYGIKKNTDS